MKALLLILLLVPFAFAHETDTPHEEPLCYPTETANFKPFIIPYVLLALGLACVVAWQLGAKQFLVAFAVIFIVIGMSLLWFAMELNRDTMYFGVVGDVHEHADFAVLINNQLVDFTDPYYMTFIGQERSRFVHLHNPDHVVHVHASGVTWDYFFRTLNVSMTDECLDAKGTLYCNATFIVNGEEIDTLRTPINDGDRALFHFGLGNASAFFEQAVGNDSCLYSGTCPERGIAVGCAVEP